MSEPREYWAFIWYRHLDNHDSGREWATWIAREIETYEVPADLVGTKTERGEIIPERLYPVFRDEDELSAGADLASPIYQALRLSKSLVVICSPRAIGSRYVGNEITYYKSLDRPCGALAMMIEGEPHAGDERECFPKELKHPVDSNGKLDTSEDVEPIAADFRLPDGRQGWHSLAECRKHLSDENAVSRYRQQCELAKLKIIAGILGIPLGELTERDKAYQLALAKERARIVTAVATAMTVLAALAIAAGAFAWVKRKEAASERDNALRAQAVAEHAKGTAEDLIQEMVYNMEGKLKPLNRLDLLDDVSQAAESYFADLPEADVDPASERNRGAMLDARGRILQASGNLDASLEKYRQSLAITRRLSADNPDNRKLLQDLVISLKNVGDILVEQNRSSEANELFDEAHSAAGDILQQDLGEGGVEEFVASLLGESKQAKADAIAWAEEHPEQIELIGTAAVVTQRRADRLAVEGDFSTALEMYENVQSTCNALHIAQPEEAEWQNSRIASAYKIGGLHFTKKNFPAAKIAFEHMAELVEIELSDDPTDPDLLSKLAAASDRLGSIAASEQRASEALQLAKRAREIWKQLSDADPANFKRMRDYYVGASKLASVQKAGGDPAAARKSNTEALAIAEKLFEIDPANATWRRDLAFSLERQANYLRADGEVEQMQKLRKQAVAHHRHLANGDPDNLLKRLNLSMALNGEGLDYWLQENLEKATVFYQESEQVARSIVDDLATPDFQSRQHLALILSSLTDISEARERYDDALRWCRTYLDLIIETRDLKVVTADFVAEQIELLKQRITDLETKAASQ